MKGTLLGVLGFILQPNLQILVLNQFQLSSLEEAIAGQTLRYRQRDEDLG